MSTTYFLGAGFSAAYGLPVMNQFFSFARRSELLTQQDKQFLGGVQRFAHMGVRLITIARNNMEEILSFLEMAEQAKQIPPALTEMCKQGEKQCTASEMLRAIIARVYGPLPNRLPDLKTRMVTTFGLNGRDFAAQLGSNAPVSGPPVGFQEGTTIITTNYDLSLETSLLGIEERHIRLRPRLIGDWVSAEGHPGGEGDDSCIYDAASPAPLLRAFPNLAMEVRPTAAMAGSCVFISRSFAAAVNTATVAVAGGHPAIGAALLLPWSIVRLEHIEKMGAVARAIMQASDDGVSAWIDDVDGIQLHVLGQGRA